MAKKELELLLEPVLRSWLGARRWLAVPPALGEAAGDAHLPVAVGGCLTFSGRSASLARFPGVPYEPLERCFVKVLQLLGVPAPHVGSLLVVVDPGRSPRLDDQSVAGLQAAHFVEHRGPAGAVDDQRPLVRCPERLGEPTDA